MKKINKYLKSADQFGMPVNLKFNKEGGSFKTMCGGLLSIVWVAIMILYLTKQIIAMVNFDNIKVQTIETNVDYHQLGTVTHQDLDI